MNLGMPMDALVLDLPSTPPWGHAGPKRLADDAKSRCLKDLGTVQSTGPKEKAQP